MTAKAKAPRIANASQPSLVIRRLIYPFRFAFRVDQALCLLCGIVSRTGRPQYVYPLEVEENPISGKSVIRRFNSFQRCLFSSVRVTQTGPIGKARIINKIMPEFNRDENLIRPVRNVFLGNATRLE